MAPQPVPQIVQPACARDTQRWLDKIATPAERARTQGLLDSLQPAEPSQVDAGPATLSRAKSTAQPQTFGGGKNGWTYTATRGALQQGLATTQACTACAAWEPAPQPATQLMPQQQQAPPPQLPPRPAPAAEQQQQWGSLPPQVAEQLAYLEGMMGKQQPTAATSVASGGARAAAAAAGGNTVSSTSSTFEEQSPDVNVTTYQMAFHLAQMHPDLYAQALAATHSKPAVNANFSSDWGDSLKKGVDGAWRARFLRSVYDATNAEVYPDAGPPSARAGQQSPAEAGFFKWLARQQVYYRGLLKAGLLPAVDDKLLGRGQHSTLDTLRSLSAVARPDLLISHSQATHHPMRTCEDPELTALVRERTRVRTMGFPPPQIDGTYPTIASKMAEWTALQQQSSGEPSKVDIVFGANGGQAQGGRPFSSSATGRRPQTSSSSGRAAAARAQAERQRPASAGALLQGQGDTAAGPAYTNRGPKLTGPPAHLEKETFKSKLPIKWAAASGLTSTSQYTEAFGSLAGGAGRRLASAGASGPIKYREVSAPFGAVNPVTALAPARPAYPVPQCFTSTKPFPQGPGDATMSTQYRSTYAARDTQDVMRSIRAGLAATASTKAMATKTSVPLGKNAISRLEPADWISEKQEHYHAHKTDITGDLKRAAALKALMGGPTASAGKLTASHPEPRGAAQVVAVA